MLENQNERKILILEMACPNKANKIEKRPEKNTNYQQLSCQLPERRPEFTLKVADGNLVLRCKNTTQKRY